MSQIIDPSFDIHPKTKGSYRRRAEDIERALQRLRIDNLSNEAAFLIYYFACEKPAKIIIGVSNKESASKYFDKNYSLRISNLLSSCKKIGLSMSENSIYWIFSSKCDGQNWKIFLISSKQIPTNSKNPKSARWLRNKIVHDIGPTHAVLIREQAPFLITEMKNFLSSTKFIVRSLESG